MIIGRRKRNNRSCRMLKMMHSATWAEEWLTIPYFLSLRTQIIVLNYIFQIESTSDSIIVA